jgi:hypothetical protein
MSFHAEFSRHASTEPRGPRFTRALFVPAKIGRPCARRPVMGGRRCGADRAGKCSGGVTSATQVNIYGSGLRTPLAGLQLRPSGGAHLRCASSAHVERI